MKKYFFLILGFTVLMTSGCNLTTKENITQQTDIKSPKLCIQNKDICFSISIAETPQQRQQGLMFVEYIPEQSGMIFLFENEGMYNFWMKNTLIPLDMIRINSGNQIIDIQTATPCTNDPCQIYTPGGQSNKVLEINAELSKKYNITTGDIINIE